MNGCPRQNPAYRLALNLSVFVNKLLTKTKCGAYSSLSFQTTGEFFISPQLHHSVMLQETIAALNIIPEGIYIDGTFGRGGHSREILKCLNEKGKLICLDKDPAAIAYGQEIFANDKRILFFQACFSQLFAIAKECGVIHAINGLLLDLGVSSPQLDEASRGFSFMREGPLDMRMDPTTGISAQDWLNQASHGEIAIVLKRYGEEPFAGKIAKHILLAREQQPITTTLALANIVASCVPAQKRDRHVATKTFQAIRIYINQELQVLERVLKNGFEILAPKGRLALISFHSLEDRIVKQFFRSQAKITLPKGVALPEKELIPPLELIVKRQRPSDNEINANPRARSATLRVAEKR